MSLCVWWVWTRDLWKPTERTAVSLEANDGTAELEDDCRRRLSIGDWTSSLSATITCSPSWLDYQSINFDSWPIRCRFIHFFLFFFFFNFFSIFWTLSGSTALQLPRHVLASPWKSVDWWLIEMPWLNPDGSRRSKLFVLLIWLEEET